MRHTNTTSTVINTHCLRGEQHQWRTCTQRLGLRLEERTAGGGRERVRVRARAPAARLRRRGLRLRRVARVGAASGPQQHTRRQLRLREAHKTLHWQPVMSGSFLCSTVQERYGSVHWISLLELLIAQ